MKESFGAGKVELSCGKQKRNGRITYFKVRKWGKEEETEEKIFNGFFDSYFVS